VIHHGLHLFLSIITFGLWLVSWVSISIIHQLRPWRCPQCGWHKPLTRAQMSNRAPVAAGSKVRAD
jgi:hypothetical protein